MELVVVALFFLLADYHTSPEASPSGLLRIGRFGCTLEDFDQVLCLAKRNKNGI